MKHKEKSMVNTFEEAVERIKELEEENKQLTK